MADAELLARLRSEIDAIESRSGFHDVSASRPNGGRQEGRAETFATSYDDVSSQHAEQVSGSEGNNAARAFRKIVALVNASDKSELAIRARLSRDGFDEREIEEAVERAKRYGLIDDARFADVLIRSRISQGRGSCGIERELKSNGIDIYAVPGWPYDYPVDHEAELQRALGLLERRPPRSKNAREGAYRKLVGKGYSSSIATTAARIWSE